MTIGHTVGKAFGGGDYVRLDLAMLEGEVAAGTAVAGLDFVQHQQHIMSIADIPQLIQIIIGRNDNAARLL